MTKQCLRGNGVSGLTRFQSCEKERPVVGAWRVEVRARKSQREEVETKNAPGLPAEVAAYGVLDGGRAISGVNTGVFVDFLFTLLLQAPR